MSEGPAKRRRKIDPNYLLELLRGEGRDVTMTVLGPLLTYKELARLERVHPEIREAIRETNLWMAMYRRDYPRYYHIVKGEPGYTMKEPYRTWLDDISKQANDLYTYWKRLYEFEMTKQADLSANNVDTFKKATLIKVIRLSADEIHVDNIRMRDSWLMQPAQSRIDKSDHSLYFFVANGRFFGDERTDKELVTDVFKIDLLDGIQNISASGCMFLDSIVTTGKYEKIYEQNDYFDRSIIYPYEINKGDAAGLKKAHPFFLIAVKGRRREINPDNYIFEILIHYIPYKVAVIPMDENDPFGLMVPRLLVSQNIICTVCQTEKATGKCEFCDAKYCSRECQQEDWKYGRHKERCLI